MDTTSLEKAGALTSNRLRQFDDLPGPRGIPVFGNALQIDSSRMHLKLEAWCHEFGPVFKLRIGKRKIVVVADHERVTSILRDRPDGFRRTTRLDEIWSEMGLMPGVFGATGDAWRHQRRMVMAGFDPAHVKTYFPSLLQVAQRLNLRWQRAAHQGQAIDLQADLMRFTVDTIAGLAFGADVNTLESDQDVIQQHLNRIFPAVFKRVFAPVPMWRFVRSASDRQLERSIAEVKVAVEGFIALARVRMQANPILREHPGNLLEAMIAAADQPDSGIDNQQVAGNVLTMLLAGEDTTANTIAWMIHLLWRNPHSLARTTEEVRQVCGDMAAPTLEQIDRLVYLDACVHETMRLKPVAPILPLQALRDTVIGDVQVSAGMVVISLMRRDSISESHVPRAGAFEPERWLLEESPGRPAHASKRISMPFGAGPRICPGRYLAMLEMKMVMAMLLDCFDIQSIGTPDDQEAREHLSFTMAPVGLRMRLRNRSEQAVNPRKNRE